MPTFLTGYAAFSILILVIFNIYMARKRQKTFKVKNPFDSQVQQHEKDKNKEITVAFIHKGEQDKETSKLTNIDASSSFARGGQQLQGEEEHSTHSISEKTEQQSIRNDSMHIGDNRIKVVAAIMLGAFVSILNQTLINVALPHMMNDFNVTTSTIQWLVTGYMLVNGVLIPISPFLIAKFPTKKLFLSGMSFFTIGALICAFAPSFGFVLTGRLVQAIGAGIIMQLMMFVMLSIFPPEKRGVAMGTVGIAMMFAPAVGPTLSGWIVEHYSWRLLFYIVLPIATLDIVLASLWLKTVPKTTKPTLDTLGAVYSTLGFGGVLYGFSEAGSKGWDSTDVLVSIIVGLIFLALFVKRCLTVENPILNLRVFKYGMFTLTTIIGSVLNMAMFAAMVLLPVYLQNIRGFTPLDSGLLLLPGAIIMAIMSPISGVIFDRIGVRPLAITGLTITVITTWEFSKLTLDTTYTHIMWLYIFRMLGMSMLMMTILTSGLNVLPRHLYSHGTATANTLRQVAASLGTAFLVTVMSNRTKFHVENYTNDITANNPFIMDAVAKMKQVIPNDQVITQMLYGMVAQKSAVAGINDSFIVATALTLIALLLSFLLKKKERTST